MLLYFTLFSLIGNRVKAVPFLFHQNIQLLHHQNYLSYLLSFVSVEGAYAPNAEVETKH